MVRYYTFEEIATDLEKSIETIYYYYKKGYLKAYKNGFKYFVCSVSQGVLVVSYENYRKFLSNYFYSQRTKNKNRLTAKQKEIFSNRDCLIFNLHKKGLSRKEICKRANVGMSNLCRILRKEKDKRFYNELDF